MDGLDGQLGEIERSAKGAASALRSMTVVGIGIATAMGFAAKRAADFGENVRRSATGLGVSEKEYQKLHATFGLLDADVGDLQDAMGTVTDRVTDALEGNKTYRKELNRLGVDIQSLKGKNPAELFHALAAAGANVADKNQVVTASVRLFGDDLGRKLLPALVGGGENLALLGQRLEETGLLMSKYGVAQTKEAAMEYRFLWFVVKRLAILFGQKLAPLLRHYSKLMSEILVSNREFLESAMDEAVDTLFRAFEHVVAVLKKVDKGIVALGGYEALFARLKLSVIALSTALIGVPLAKTAYNMANFASAAIGAQMAAGQIAGALGIAGGGFAAAAGAAAILAIKIVLVVAAVLAVAAAFEDLWAYAQGGHSVIGDLITQGGVWSDVFETLAGAVILLFRWMEDILNATLDLMSWAIGSTQEWTDVLIWLAKFLGAVVLAVVGLLSAGLLIVVAAVAAVVGAIFTLGAILVETVKFIGGLIRALGELAYYIWDVVVEAVADFMAFFETPASAQKFLDIILDGFALIADYIGAASDALGDFMAMAAQAAGIKPGGASYGIANPAMAAASTRSMQATAAATSAAGGSTNTVNVNAPIDARGADAATVERLPGEIMRESDRRRALAGFSGGER